jgi:SAM-dependent methyltransferase
MLAPLDARIPAWDTDCLIRRDCPVCGSDSGPRVCTRPDGLDVRACARCGTYFVDPAPSAEHLQAFYREYDERHRRAPRMELKDLAAIYSTLKPLDDLRIRELSSLMPLEGARVLDVGFGRGEFLYRMRALGAQPFGVEFDPRAVESIRSLGIGAFLGDVVELETDHRFDLVSLLDFVEHPLRPMDALIAASKLLAKGGLLILWTPNGDAGRATASGQVTFRVDLEHMQYFTPETCLQIAARLKLSVVHLETLGFPELGGMDKSRKAPAGRLDFMMRSARRASWYRAAWKWKHKLLRVMRDEGDDRRGTYHLFCIMRKP